LDAEVTEKKELWKTFKSSRTERDEAEKKNKTAKKEALAGNVEAAKGEFLKAQKAMAAKRKAYQEAMNKLPEGASTTAATAGDP